MTIPASRSSGIVRITLPHEPGRDHRVGPIEPDGFQEDPGRDERGSGTGAGARAGGGLFVSFDVRVADEQHVTRRRLRWSVQDTDPHPEERQQGRRGDQGRIQRRSEAPAWSWRALPPRLSAPERGASLATSAIGGGYQWSPTGDLLLSDLRRPRRRLGAALESLARATGRDPPDDPRRLTLPSASIRYRCPYGPIRYAKEAMSKGRLEAFSDGVIAIVITIMVLELAAAPRADARGAVRALAGLPGVRAELPVRGHLLEQPPPPVPGGARRRWPRAVGEPRPALLPVALPVRDGVDGRDGLRRRAGRRLRGHPAGSRAHLLRARPDAAADRSRPSPGWRRRSAATRRARSRRSSTSSGSRSPSSRRGSHSRCTRWWRRSGSSPTGASSARWHGSELIPHGARYVHKGLRS